MTRIQELATLISTNTEKINQHLISTNQPTPSFDAGSPDLDLPHDVQALRELVIEASSELQELLMGPKELLMSNSPTQLLSLHAIYHYQIAEMFPVGAEMTFHEISNRCGLNELDVRRILRDAISHRVFREVRKGVVVHTAVSQLLAEDPQMRAWTGACVEEMWPAAVQTVSAMIKWPNSQEPSHTGFSLANNTDDALYTHLSQNPSRAARFGQGMSAFTTSSGFELHHLTSYPLWSSLPPSSRIVDLGGSHGDAMIALTQKYPSLNCVVQDLPSTIESRLAKEGRVKFMAHDFFEPQPVKNADVYFFRWIFHNWSDGYCIRILRALIPALKPQAAILIMDGCLPEPGVLSLGRERKIRSMDLAMLQIQNSREREGGDWETLFREADPRFKFLGVEQPRGSKLALIEARWEDAK